MVSVVIVNYNTFEVTCNCIESALQFTKDIPFEIILVDNASPDGRQDEFLVRFPSIKLVKSKDNGGFAKGNNQGIKASSGDIILLLNSDTVLTENSIKIAADHLLRHSDIGALTVRLVYPDGKLQHTARKFRSIRNELLDLCRPLLRLIPYKTRSALMMNQYFHGDYNTYCDWVSGAFMMFPRTILDQLPDEKLDERYFMYGEDQLWCYQFRQMGLLSFYVSETTVIHINNASTKPSKQLALLKKFISVELDIMRYRKGRSLYYYIFDIIFTTKEMARYAIKLLAYSFTGRRIR